MRNAPEREKSNGAAPELDTEFSSFFYAEKSPRILSKEDLDEEEREIMEREDREEEAVRRREKARRERSGGQYDL